MKSYFIVSATLTLLLCAALVEIAYLPGQAIILLRGALSFLTICTALVTTFLCQSFAETVVPKDQYRWRYAITIPCIALMVYLWSIIKIMPFGLSDPHTFLIGTIKFGIILMITHFALLPSYEKGREMQDWEYIPER